MSARTKYPRTFHCPWSLSATSDDKTWGAADMVRAFEGREVVVTEKLDGENTTIYADGYCHARSIDSTHHPSRAWAKALAAQIGMDIPKGWRICGENLYAKHSVGYDRLGSYFYVFAIFDENGTLLSWDEMIEWAELIGIEIVPLLYRGVYNEKAIRKAWDGSSALSSSEGEGYVIRHAGRITDFSKAVAKFVRANHVQTDQHWMHNAVVPNTLMAP